MRKRKLTLQSGVTLMEVTIAVAIFSVVIAISAQALGSFYATMDMQEERIEAAQRARSVLNAIRDKRSQYQNANNTFDWNGMLAWLAAQEDDDWEGYLSDPADGGALDAHAISVAVLSLDGGAAAPGETPVEIHVSSSWEGLGGREMEVTVAAILGER